MNILVIGKFYTEGFALHIAETLADMGHTVRRFEPGQKAHRIPGRIGRRLDQILATLHTTSDNLPAIRARRMRTLWRAVEKGRWMWSLWATIFCGQTRLRSSSVAVGHRWPCGFQMPS
jgi:hypothetical protein